MLIKWRGKEFTDEELKGKFHVSSMLGQGCQIQVAVINKNNKAFNNIQEIKALFENISAPVIKNELLLFDMHNWNYDVFYKLPEWIQNKIKKSTQYQKKYAQLETLDFKEEKANIKSIMKPVMKEGVLI
jgi:hypothetical protein